MSVTGTHSGVLEQHPQQWRALVGAIDNGMAFLLAFGLYNVRLSLPLFFCDYLYLSCIYTLCNNV